MANLNLSNFIIDRILSGVGYATDGSVYFKMDQCQDTSITCGSEATEIVDNVGAPVMTLYRAKTCEISGQNAILDMNLTAFQMGANKTVAREAMPVTIATAGMQGGSYVEARGGLSLALHKSIYNVLCDQNYQVIVYATDDSVLETIAVSELKPQPYVEDATSESYFDEWICIVYECEPNTAKSFKIQMDEDILCNGFHYPVRNEYKGVYDSTLKRLTVPLAFGLDDALCKINQKVYIYDADDTLVAVIPAAEFPKTRRSFNSNKTEWLSCYYCDLDEYNQEGCYFIVPTDGISELNGTTIITQAAEVITVPDTHTVNLSHVPTTNPKYIYTLNNDGSLGRCYEVGTGDGAFLISGKTLVLPEDIDVGTDVFVSYEYEATAGIEIVNSAKNFPKSCKLVLKALGYNPCEKDNKLACYIIFPSFEMSPDFDLSLQAGETQAWSGKASQDYCSKDKRLMSIVVVDEDDEMF